MLAWLTFRGKRSTLSTPHIRHNCKYSFHKNEIFASQRFSNGHPSREESWLTKSERTVKLADELSKVRQVWKNSQNVKKLISIDTDNNTIPGFNLAPFAWKINAKSCFTLLTLSHFREKNQNYHIPVYSRNSYLFNKHFEITHILNGLEKVVA